MFWNDSIKVEIIGYSEYHVDVEVDSLLGVHARFTFVYGEAQVNERFKTWNMMRGIASSSSLPWAALGDFNEVLRADEHDGVGNRSQAQMDAFRDTIDTCGLADIGYQGTPWTFEKRVTGGTYTRVRLDRCVASPEWSLAFPSAKLEHKNTASSDHAATLLTLADDAFNVRPRSFRYELMWERHPDFMDMVNENWNRSAQWGSCKEN